MNDEVLQKLLDAHADKMTVDYLEACGIPGEVLIDAAANLLHEHGTGKPAIHHLCSEGLALLLKLALCAGYECGIKSCAGFGKPN
jgi:hypothetical protein